MECSSYTQALALCKRGPTVVVNLPDTLMVWCTPLDRIAPHLWDEATDPDTAQRARFIVHYAVRMAALGSDSRPRA